MQLLSASLKTPTRRGDTVRAYDAVRRLRHVYEPSAWAMLSSRHPYQPAALGSWSRCAGQQPRSCAAGQKTEARRCAGNCRQRGVPWNTRTRTQEDARRGGASARGPRSGVDLLMTTTANRRSSSLPIYLLPPCNPASVRASDVALPRRLHRAHPTRPLLHARHRRRRPPACAAAPHPCPRR